MMTTKPTYNDLRSRMDDTSGIELPALPCHTCGHWNNGLTCEAFPKGIPDSILSGDEDHRTPIKGDGGILYLDNKTGLIHPKPRVKSIAGMASVFKGAPLGNKNAVGGHAFARRPGSIGNKRASGGGSSATSIPILEQSPKAILDHSARMSDATQDMWGSLSDSEKKSVSDYTGSQHEAMNEAIGEGRVGESPAIHAQVKTLDSALEKMSLPEGGTLYRASDVSRLLGDTKRYGKSSSIEELSSLVGKTFSDPAFGSTSPSLREAKSYSSSGRVVMEIRAPKGTTGAWLGGGDNRSDHPGEQEFLLPRDREYKVVGAKERTFIHPLAGEQKQTVLEVELLNHNKPSKVLKHGGWVNLFKGAPLGNQNARKNKDKYHIPSAVSGLTIHPVTGKAVPLPPGQAQALRSYSQVMGNAGNSENARISDRLLGAFHNVLPTKANQVLFRGVGADDTQWANAKPGDPFELKGPWSTTVDKKVGEGYREIGGDSDGRKAPLLEIHLPKGSKAISMDLYSHHRNDPDYDEGRDESEHEVLLPPGKLKVRSVSEDRVVLDVVEQAKTKYDKESSEFFDEPKAPRGRWRPPEGSSKTADGRYVDGETGELFEPPGWVRKDAHLDVSASVFKGAPLGNQNASKHKANGTGLTGEVIGSDPNKTYDGKDIPTHTVDHVRAKLKELSDKGISSGYTAEDFHAKTMGRVDPVEMVKAIWGENEYADGKIVGASIEEHTGGVGYEHLKGRVSFAGTGEVHGSKVGWVERCLSKDMQSIDHTFLQMEDGEGNKGTAKALFTNSLPLYKKMGLKAITVHANLEAGAYAWSKFGFTPDDLYPVRKSVEDGMSRIIKKANEGIPREDRVPLSKEAMKERDALHAILSSDDKHMATQLANLPTPNLDDHFGHTYKDSKDPRIPDNIPMTFVKTAMSGGNWNATHHFSDVDSAKQLRDYLTTKKAKTP